MSLRTRLVLTLIAVSVPLVGALTWARGVLDERAEVDALSRFIAGRMEDGRAICEADPEHFPAPRRRSPRGPGRPEDRPRDSERRGGPPPRGPGPGPGPEPGAGSAPRPGRGGPPPIELFAYAPSFESANPRAPEFSAELRRQLEGGATQADERIEEGERRSIRVALRMPWGTGPAAIVTAVRPVEGPPGLTRNQLITASALALVLALTLFIAVGPIVQRVRRLTLEVRDSAKSRYATGVSVTGSDEISELAREFNDARGEVQRQFRAVEGRERALREFIANTTHDIMIPMTVLKGHLSSLRGADSAPDSAVLHDAMEEVQYITSLLQNLGASAKLEGAEGSLGRDTVDLSALLERVVARHSPIGRQKNVEVNLSLPPEPLPVIGDLTLLEQAVSNLVHNAVRYGTAGGHVALLLDAGPGPAWRLRILDDGPGIDAAELERLLQRSTRGDEARTRHPEGQGLGLHIAREVAERHAIALEFRRSEYGGLEVELRGTRAPAPAPPSGRSASS